MCVGEVKDQRECGKKCEKGKVRECERRLSASVMNSCICAWVSIRSCGAQLETFFAGPQVHSQKHEMATVCGHNYQSL